MANILLVDPDENAFLALKGFLARDEHRSACVSSAQKAMDFLRENVLVDLIFVELKLEASTGLAFLKTLRNDYFFRDVPVVFYAAKTTHAEIQEAYGMGVQSFHRKPYVQESILDEVAKVQGKQWYWSFFESDDVFCQRTGFSLDELAAVLEELIPVIQSASQSYKELAEKFLKNSDLTDEIKEVEIKNLFLQISELRGDFTGLGVPNLEKCLNFLTTCALESRWDEFKNAAEALGYYAVLFSYRADICKLDRKTKQATAVLDRLAKNALIRSLPPHEMHAMIPNLRDTEIEEGATLFRQGDAGDAMYLIVHGQLGVYIETKDEPEPKKIAEIKDGDIVGEMALIKNAPRSATIIAQSDTQMMRLDKIAFKRLILQSPQMKQAVQALAEHRSMDTINKRAGTIDVSDWSKTASQKVREMSERIPIGFLGKDDEKEKEEIKRGVASVDHWNKMVDSKTFPVVSDVALKREIAALKGCPVTKSASAAFTLTTSSIVTSLHPVMDLVERDPGLAFQMLQAGNEVRQAKKKDSSTFIEDVRMCVNVIGEKRLGSMAKSLPHFHESFMYLNHDENWHSYLKFLLATANIAQFTCHFMKLISLEQTAFLGGLIHDIGKLLFLSVQPAGFSHVYLYAHENNVSVLESELLHMNLSTRQMAIDFIEKRCFPTCFKSVIRWVDEPDQATEDIELVMVVAVARYMCRLCRVGFSGDITPHDMLPLEHSRLWDSIQHRVLPSFNVSHYEMQVRSRLRQL